MSNALFYKLYCKLIIRNYNLLFSILYLISIQLLSKLFNYIKYICILHYCDDKTMPT